MKSKCVDGRPHEIWYYIIDGVEHQVCRKIGCQLHRARKLNGKEKIPITFSKGHKLANDIIRCEEINR